MTWTTPNSTGTDARCVKSSPGASSTASNGCGPGLTTQGASAGTRSSGYARTAAPNGNSATGESMATGADRLPIFVPIKAGRGMNAREHWQQRHRRVKGERKTTAWVLATAKRPQLPCSALLTRVAPSSGLDDDNLAGSLKSVRDEVAKWLGVDDKDRMTVRYRYAQARGPWGVRIEFGEPAVGAQMTLDIEDAA